jgi:OOP family OmpA-OmpF porin
MGSIMRRLCFLLSLALPPALASPLAAQELSDADLLTLFEAQRDAFAEAEASGLGATRGLELVTVDDLTTDPALQGEGEPVAGAETGTPEETGASVALSSDPVTFGQLAPNLQVNVRITFPFDSAVLTEDQVPKLDQLCEVMSQSDIGLFRIVGHTDAAGSDAYNERLSLLRAEEVVRYFTGTCGLDASRLEAVGMGERFLADPADPRAGDNRRVEFQALS